MTAQAFETARCVVYPWQLDHMGHMNVQFYAARFDEATWHFLARYGITPQYLREHRRGMVAAEQHTRYLRELHAGDLICVSSELLEARPKAVRFHHCMRNATTGEAVATTEFTGVHLDTDARRSVPFPDEIAARLAAALTGRAPGQDRTA